MAAYERTVDPIRRAQDYDRFYAVPPLARPRSSRRWPPRRSSGAL
jgi:hypothetical protein